jgi:hypothetical protein
LFQVSQINHPRRGGADMLHPGGEQAEQDRYDQDNDCQFSPGEAGMFSRHGVRSHSFSSRALPVSEAFHQRL